MVPREVSVARRVSEAHQDSLLQVDVVVLLALDDRVRTRQFLLPNKSLHQRKHLSYGHTETQINPRFTTIAEIQTFYFE